jgi:hypothetical protein
LRETSPASPVVQYSAAGQPVSAAYSDGMTKTWTYGSGGTLEEKLKQNVVGEPYVTYKWNYDAAGNLADTIATSASGAQTITARESGLTLGSTSGGRDTFVFDAGFGSDTLADFSGHLSGADRDKVSLPSSDFQDFAQMLSDAKFSGGDAVITATNGDRLTIDNISQTTLSKHHGDFVFRA